MEEDCNDTIVAYLSRGFKLLDSLQQAASKRLQMLNEKNKDDQFTRLNTIRVDVESPKLVIDEYLVGEKVLNRKRPMFLLLDMGRWRFKNASSIK